jgi:hypothetical protein
MAYSPENGSVPKNPSISYAPGATGQARQQASSSGSSSSGGSTNRAGSVKRRQQLNQQTKARDKATGQPLIQQDASFGLTRPYIPWNVYPFAQEAAPPVTTASGSFVSLMTCAIEPQHPRIRVRARVVMGASTAGELRLVDRATGTVINGPLIIGSGVTVETNLDGTLIAPTLSGAGAPMKVDVQGRVTSGGSNLALLVVYAVGIGS